MMKSMKKKVVGAMLGLCVAAAAVPAATSFAATKSTGVTQTAENKPGQRNGQKNGQNNGQKNGQRNGQKNGHQNGQQAPGERGMGRGGRMRGLPVDELVQDGVISQETGEKIQKWMEEKRTERKESAGQNADGTSGEKKARTERPANAADGSAREKKSKPERNSDGTKKEKPEKSTGSTDASTSDSKTAGKSAGGSANGGQKAGRSDGAGARGGFSDDMLKELVDAGILTQKEANAIQEKYSKGNDAA